MYASKKDEPLGCIYCLTNSINGKKYVGLSMLDTTGESRWKTHQRSAQKGKFPLYAAMRKYGTGVFTLSVLEVAAHSFLNALEIKHIEQLDTTNRKKGYNATYGGSASLMTPEVREKHRVAVTLASNRPEMKEKKRAYANRPEMLEKMRATLHTPEMKERLRAIRQNPEMKEKFRATQQTPEIKEKRCIAVALSLAKRRAEQRERETETLVKLREEIAKNVSTNSVTRMILASLLLTLDSKQRTDAAECIWRMQQNGSVGDGNFDRAVINAHNKDCDTAANFILNPYSLFRD